MNYLNKKHINEIKKKGFVRIKKFLSTRETLKYKKLVFSNYNKLKIKSYKGTPKRDSDDKILYNLQNKNLEFIKLITRKKILDIAKYFLNDPYYRFLKEKEPNFNLKYFNARSSGKELELHIDCHLPFKGSKTNMMQFLILLENSDIANGCTKVVPRSHLSGNFSNRKTNMIEPLAGNAGDLIIWDSRLWHGTYKNVKKKTRWAIVATFGSWWLKPAMDITKSLPNSIYKKCNNVQKQILGFCSIPPKDEFERVNTKTGYNDLKKNVSDYFL